MRICQDLRTHLSITSSVLASSRLSDVFDSIGVSLAFSVGRLSIPTPTLALPLDPFECHPRQFMSDKNAKIQQSLNWVQMKVWHITFKRRQSHGVLLSSDSQQSQIWHSSQPIFEAQYTTLDQKRDRCTQGTSKKESSAEAGSQYEGGPRRRFFRKEPSHCPEGCRRLALQARSRVLARTANLRSQGRAMDAQQRLVRSPARRAHNKHRPDVESLLRSGCASKFSSCSSARLQMSSLLTPRPSCRRALHAHTCSSSENPASCGLTITGRCRCSHCTLMFNTQALPADPPHQGGHRKSRGGARS